MSTAERPLTPWRDELTALWRLALPIVLAQVGMITMGLVDTMMVGRVSQEALAAVALGNLYTFWFLGFGMGVLHALDPLVSQALGADDHEAAARAIQRGLVLALVLSVPTCGLILLARPAFRWLGQPDVIVPDAAGYAEIIATSVPAFLLFVLLRRGLEALHRTLPIVVAVVAANLVNVGLNWVLVFGRLGMPALGAEGSAWATSVTRWLMVGLLLGLGGRELRPFLRPWRAASARGRAVLAVFRLGLPIGVQYSLEMGVFSAVSIFMGWLGTAELAANQIALQLASLTFMVPLAISMAGAVRIGHAVGREDGPTARRAAGGAVVSGMAVMGLSATVFITAPRLLAAAFTDQASVIATAAALIRVAAVFQLFDGLQVVAVGLLRGIGDTKTPVLVNMVGFPGIALPLALWLGFETSLGAAGLWWGLAAGLAVVACTLLALVRHRLAADVRRLELDEGTEG